MRDGRVALDQRRGACQLCSGGDPAGKFGVRRVKLRAV
ncbi:MAG: hypothetical protein OJF61_000214 [Rhodanobacteraceae bacterium]|nr:MAG: hypothetical protein OJF61_000214 [Rhodanobacteraceae bacterium]